MVKNKNVKESLLTPREKEIILLCTEDYSRKMIASALKISIRTVDSHLKNIHIKTKTHTIAGIVAFGFRNSKSVKKT